MKKLLLAIMLTFMVLPTQAMKLSPEQTQEIKIKTNIERMVRMVFLDLVLLPVNDTTVISMESATIDETQGTFELDILKSDGTYYKEGELTLEQEKELVRQGAVAFMKYLLEETTINDIIYHKYFTSSRFSLDITFQEEAKEYFKVSIFNPYKTTTTKGLTKSTYK